MVVSASWYVAYAIKVMQMLYIIEVIPWTIPRFLLSIVTSGDTEHSTAQLGHSNICWLSQCVKKKQKSAPAVPMTNASGTVRLLAAKLKTPFWGSRIVYEWSECWTDKLCDARIPVKAFHCSVDRKRCPRRACACMTCFKAVDVCL